MTISEAQSILHCPDAYGGIFGEKYGQALELAFEALKQTGTLDKIRAEIDRQQKWLLQAGYTMYNVDIAFDAIKAVVAESEVQDADSD